MKIYFAGDVGYSVSDYMLERESRRLFSYIDLIDDKRAFTCPKAFEKIIDWLKDI